MMKFLSIQSFMIPSRLECRRSDLRSRILDIPDGADVLMGTVSYQGQRNLPLDIGLGENLYPSSHIVYPAP